MWSVEETNFILNNYKSMTYNKISILLNRPYGTLYRKISSMGLLKINRRTKIETGDKFNMWTVGEAGPRDSRGN